MRFAVDDIRQEVVERPWFGRETTPEWVTGMDDLTPTEHEAVGPQDYGARDPLEPQDGEALNRWRDAVRDHTMTGREHERAADWEADKTKAEDLYGRDPEQEIER